MKSLSFVTAAVLACSAASWGSGYAISAHSVRSYALNNAYVAYTDSADSAYFNPANMVWLDNGAMIDVGGTYINNTETKFNGSAWGIPASASSESENAFLPFIHLVSPKIENCRFGLSIVAPEGIAKRWNSPMQMITAEESSLDVIEVNPSVAYELNPNLSVGLGIRFAFAKSKMKAQMPPGFEPILIQGYRQDMEGDDWAVGYNMAVTYKPTDTMHLAATYRSKIDLKLEGEGTGYTTDPYSGLVYPFKDTQGYVSIPLPAMLALAVSQTFDKLTLEFVYERMFWSAYDEMDINFRDPYVEGTLGQARPQNWKDTNDFRLGLSYGYNDDLKLMCGASYEESPVPANTLGFDLPDSDILWFSGGFVYAFKSNVEVGLAYTYGQYDDRSIELTDANINGIIGEFSDTAFQSLTAGVTYKF